LASAILAPVLPAPGRDDAGREGGSGPVDQQLPPTSFFEAVSVDGDDEWEEDQFEEFESILKLGKGSAGLRELPLKWHYRSQHENLIAYSNYSFYKGRLVTFPGVVAEASDLGVKFYPVTAGVYRRGTARDNPKEAEVVVERVLYWANTPWKAFVSVAE
jgi:superfamily I DNA and/or RNA helicase